MTDAGSHDHNATPEDDWDDLLDIGLRKAVPAAPSDRRTPSTAEDATRSVSGPTLGAALGSLGARLPSLGQGGRYILLGEIGRGGMGVVYEARDLELGRAVAIKLLRDAPSSSAERAQRFVEEAQIGSQLQHPGIVPIHDVGRTETGSPFFVMKLVSGQTLKARLEGQKPVQDGIEPWLRIFLQICQAVAYAHARGVIHRDLKPSNIMLGPFGEIHVMDWGLAKVLARAEPAPAAEVVQTVRSGQGGWESLGGTIVGTPAYMAPEQARGETARIGPASDVFSLGAILYELLTGKPPYSGNDSKALREQAAGGPSAEALARLDACGADPELAGIARSCLRAEPEARAHDASIVASAVADHLATAERRVHDARVKAAEEHAHLVHERRARRLTMLLASSILLAVLVGGGTWILGRERARERSAEATAAMAGALDRAVALRSSATEAGDDALALFAEALAVAEAARSVGGASDADEGVRRRAEAFVADVADELATARAQAADAAREREMIAELDQLRTLATFERDFTDIADACARTFAKLGFDVDRSPDEQLARGIAATGIAPQFRQALDLWIDAARHRSGPLSPLATRLLGVALAADDDPVRIRLRRAAHERDRATLESLREDPAATVAGLETGTLLAEALGHTLGPNAAITHYRRLLAANPSDFWTNVGLSYWLGNLEEDHRAEALSYARAAFAVNPRSWSGALHVAHRLDAIGRFDEAVEFAQRALRERPGLSIGQVILAGSLMELRRWEEAKVALERGLELDPRSALAMHSLGFWHEANGDRQRAFEAFDRAVQTRPSYALAWADRGVCLEKLDRPAEAEASYLRAIAEAPHNGRFIALLATLENRSGRPAAARVRVQEALARLPDDFHLNELQARFFFDDGDPEAAVRSWSKSLETRPDSPRPRVNRGQVLRKLGRFDLAIADLDLAVRLVAKLPSFDLDVESLAAEARADRELFRRIQNVLAGAEVMDRPEDLDATLQLLATIERHDLEIAFWERTFAARPTLFDSHGTRAIVIATRLATEEGTGPEGGRATATLATPELRRFAHRRAREWTQRLVDAGRAAATGANRSDATRLRKLLMNFLSRPELAPVREPSPKVPDDERDAWAALFDAIQEVVDLLEGA